MGEGLIKYRVLSFRLSDDEYRQVEAAGRKCGFVSASLFARAAALKGDSSEPVNTPLDLEINRVWRRVEVLTSTLEQMSVRLGSLIELIRGSEDPLSCPLT
jgi:hypothetical protein